MSEDERRTDWFAQKTQRLYEPACIRDLHCQMLRQKVRSVTRRPSMLNRPLKTIANASE